MKRPRVSICCAFHNNPTMLGVQHDAFRAMPPDVLAQIEFVVCDDASDMSAFHMRGEPRVSTRVFRIEPPHVRWSHRCATNIAAHHAAGEWLLLTDIDHVVPVETLQYLIAQPLHRETVFKFPRTNKAGDVIKPHPDSWLIHRKIWKRIGGWDERYRGLYGQNADIWRRVRYRADEPVELPVYLVGYGRDDVPDASSPPDYRENKLPDKEAIKVLRQQFRDAGTFYKSHQLTVPYVEVAP